MSFPYYNVEHKALVLLGISSEATTSPMIKSSEYPLFNVPQVVDLSAMQMDIVQLMDASTGVTQTMASGTTTVVLNPYDGGTNAANAGTATGVNNIFGNDDWSNSATGTNSWTVVHGARKQTGTSATDLDATDWVNLDVDVNISGAGGFGAINVAAWYAFGKPGAVA